MLKTCLTIFSIIMIYTSSFAEIFVFPDKGRQPYIDFIQQAEKSLDIMAYVIDDEKIQAALMAAKKKGVCLRLIVEGEKYSHESTQSSSANALERLKKQGIGVHTTPSTVTQMHAKLFLRDGKEALVSTGNLDTESFDGIPGGDSACRDFALLLSDKKTCQELQRLFDLDWSSKPVAASSFSHVALAPGSYREWVVSHIDKAKKTIDLYQQDITDPKILEALKNAAKRGVKLRLIMTPHPFSKKWDNNIEPQEFLKILGAQVTLKKDLYIHTKILLIDHGTPKARAVFGSSNFYKPSLDKNREIGLLIDDPQDLKTLSLVFESDL